MPAAAIKAMLEREPKDPAIAAIPAEPQDDTIRMRPPISPPGRFRPGTQQRLRRHLSEMQQLMDFMRREMEALESGRW